MIISHYFLSEAERERYETAVLAAMPECDLSVLMELDDCELHVLYEAVQKKQSLQL